MLMMMLMLMLMLLLLLMMIIIVLEANRRRKYSNDTAQQGRTESLQENIVTKLTSCRMTILNKTTLGKNITKNPKMSFTNY